MKTKRTFPAPAFEPTEDDIRAYAYHLYEQAGCMPGRDLENWLEAKACLLANIPSHAVHTRLHQHMNKSGQKPGVVTVVTLETTKPAAVPMSTTRTPVSA